MDEHVLHDEHQAIREEHRRWSQDVTSWRLEHRRLEERLARLQAVLREQESRLVAHADAIWEHDLFVTRLDAALHAHARGLDAPALRGLAAERERFVERHERLRAEHGTLTQRQRALDHEATKLLHPTGEGAPRHETGRLEPDSVHWLPAPELAASASREGRS